MINIRNGEYNPRPVYNRKLLRDMIRSKCWNDRTGHVSRRVHDSFQKIMGGKKDANREAE